MKKIFTFLEIQLKEFANDEVEDKIKILLNTFIRR